MTKEADKPKDIPEGTYGIFQLSFFFINLLDLIYKLEIIIRIC